MIRYKMFHKWRTDDHTIL